MDNWILSPRIGVRASITNNLTWRTTLSTGFRAPAVFDENRHIAQVGGEGFVVENDPDLREEKSVSFSGGLDYAGLVSTQRYNLGANVFYTELHKMPLLLWSERTRAATVSCGGLTVRESTWPAST